VVTVAINRSHITDSISDDNNLALHQATLCQPYLIIQSTRSHTRVTPQWPAGGDRSNRAICLTIIDSIIVATATPLNHYNQNVPAPTIKSA